MLALILGIAANVGWIAFDIWASIVTYPALSHGYWILFVATGALLIAFTIFAGVLAYRSGAQADKRHTHEHEVLAQGTIATLERLATITQTTGRSDVEVIQAATVKIETLEGQVADVTSIFWRPLREDERGYLRAELSKIGSYSVRISPDAQTDCRELASSLYRIFDEAGWTLERIPSGVTWESAGASGISILGKYPADNEPAYKVMDALVRLVKGGLQFAASLDKNDKADVLIIIGPKQARSSWA